jgi:hypothetical protein
MRRVVAAVAIGAFGLFASLVGQAIWRQSPDEIWAACAVVGVLSGFAVAFQSSISKLLNRLTRA